MLSGIEIFNFFVSDHFNAVSYCSGSSNSEGTHFLTYQVIKTIKLHVTFRRESSVAISYHFF